MEKSGQPQIDQFHPAESQSSAQSDGQQADIDRMIEGIFIVIFDVGQAEQKGFIIYEVIKDRLNQTPGGIKPDLFIVFLPLRNFPQMKNT